MAMKNKIHGNNIETKANESFDNAVFYRSEADLFATRIIIFEAKSAYLV